MGHHSNSRLYSMRPTPFSTPPMPRKTLFQDSPQSETQKTHSAACGHSPGPSPSWEHTPQSHMSGQSQEGLVTVDQQGLAHPGQPTATLHPHPYVFKGQPFLAQHATALAAAAPAVTVTAMPSPAATSRNIAQQVFAPPQQEHSVEPVMTSSRKRAAIGSLSPQIRPFPSHPRTTEGHAPHANPMDPAWETRFQEAFRQAVLALNSPASLTDTPAQPAQQLSLLTLSATALAEAEAAHVAQG